MALKLVEIHEYLMINKFLNKLPQFEKTVFIPLRNLKNNVHFRNKESIKFFVTLTRLLFDTGVLLPFSNENELNLKRNQKSNHEKSKLSLIFYLKKKKQKKTARAI